MSARRGRLIGTILPFGAAPGSPESAGDTAHSRAGWRVVSIRTAQSMQPRTGKCRPGESGFQLSQPISLHVSARGGSNDQRPVGTWTGLLSSGRIRQGLTYQSGYQGRHSHNDVGKSGDVYADQNGFHNSSHASVHSVPTMPMYNGEVLKNLRHHCERNCSFHGTTAKDVKMTISFHQSCHVIDAKTAGT